MWRYFTYSNSKRYIDILPKILNSYNNSFHRSIQTIPSKVNRKNAKIFFLNLYGYNLSEGSNQVVRLLFKQGDYVRLVIDKNIFEKGYTPNWSKEIFIVDSILLKPSPLYKIKSLNGETLEDKFYAQELQKVYPNEFPYDTLEVINSDNNFLKVKQLNSTDQHIYTIDINKI